MLIAAWILIRGFECRMRRPAAHTQPRWWPPDMLPALSVQMLGEVLANFQLIRAKPAELDERGCNRDGSPASLRERCLFNTGHAASEFTREGHLGNFG